MVASSVQRRDTPLAVQEGPQRIVRLQLQWAQFTALCKKHLLIRARAWKTNLLLVAQAVLFVLLTWGVDRGVTASRQRQPAFRDEPQARIRPVGQVPDCSNNVFLRQGEPCYTLLYAPQGVEAVERIVWGVANNNVPPIPAAHIRSFQNASQVDEFLLEHPETVLGTVVFVVDGSNSISFSLQTNSSIQWFKGHYQDPNTYMQLPLQSAVERELVRYMSGQPGLGWDVSLAQFPHPASQSPSMIGQFAPTFLFASIMFQFVLLVHDVVCEKESGVRRVMNTMGLKPLPFWASWAVFQGFLAVVEAGLLVGFSYAFKFKLFLDNAFLLSFLLLLLVSLAMTAFGFFVAAFLKKAAAAVPAGFLLFVAAWIFLVVVAFGFPYSTKYSPVAQAAFSTMPWTLLGKGIGDLAAASAGPLQGLSWDERYSYCLSSSTLPPAVLLSSTYRQPKCVMPLGRIYWILAIQCAAYMLLAIYLDSVMPDDSGVKRAPWFFLQPSYWLPSKSRNLRPAQRALAMPPEWEELGLIVDADVKQEALKMRDRCRRYVGEPAAHATPSAATGQGSNSAEGGSTGNLIKRGAAASPGVINLEAMSASGVQLPGAGDTSGGSAGAGPGTAAQQEAAQQVERPYAIEMFGLRKVYSRGGLLHRRPFVAVKGNWLGVYEGECFCLLGPNGAGKSTTIHCLTGVMPLSAGEALVYGESIASSVGMDNVRPVMGVCPQFDVLWDNLTGKEHLMLFGAIKGLPSQVRAKEASRLLEEVRLSEAGGVRAGEFSGGMKRRLSVAIALLGDPKVVYLDEPTTGLDPISRRHLWDLVDKAKRGRAIVLTTHSMEEADILGDRIGIMARGRLRCVGSSLRLKSRFGSGYSISVRVAGSAKEPMPSLSSWCSATQGVLQPLEASPPLGGGGSTGSPPAQQAQRSGRACEITPTADDVAGAGGSSARQKGAADPAVAAQMARVKAVFLDRLGVKSVDEAADYLHFLVPYEHEDKLPMLFTFLKAHSWELGITDVQLRLTPLEEVFHVVSRKAELEHAQTEGRYEMLHLPEEKIAIKVPVGAEFIQSPAGTLYHIRWAPQEDGSLKLTHFWKDPVSEALAAEASEEEAAERGLSAKTRFQEGCEEEGQQESRQAAEKGP